MDIAKKILNEANKHEGEGCYYQHSGDHLYLKWDPYRIFRIEMAPELCYYIPQGYEENERMAKLFIDYLDHAVEIEEGEAVRADDFGIDCIRKNSLVRRFGTKIVQERYLKGFTDNDTIYIQPDPDRNCHGLDEMKSPLYLEKNGDLYAMILPIRYIKEVAQ